LRWGRFFTFGSEGVLYGPRAKMVLEGLWGMWREPGHENQVQSDLSV